MRTLFVVVALCSSACGFTPTYESTDAGSDAGCSDPCDVACVTVGETMAQVQQQAGRACSVIDLPYGHGGVSWHYTCPACGADGGTSWTVRFQNGPEVSAVIEN